MMVTFPSLALTWSGGSRLRLDSARGNAGRAEEESMEGFIGKAEEVAGDHAPLPFLPAEREAEGGVEGGPSRPGVEAHLRSDQGGIQGLEGHRQLLDLPKAAGGREGPVAHPEDELLPGDTSSGRGVGAFPERLEALACPQRDGLSKRALDRFGLAGPHLSMDNRRTPSKDSHQKHEEDQEAVAV